MGTIKISPKYQVMIPLRSAKCHCLDPGQRFRWALRRALLTLEAVMSLFSERQRHEVFRIGATFRC